MKKRFTILITAAVMLLSMVATTGEMWGQTRTEGDTHDFSQTLQQVLNNNASIPSINIAEQSYPVKKVTVVGSYNKSYNPAVTIAVSVGGTSWGTQQIGGSGSFSKDFTGTSTVGAIVISFTNETGNGTGHGTFNVTKVILTEGSSGSDPTFNVTFDAGDGTFVGNEDFPNTTNQKAAGTYSLPNATRANYTLLWSDGTDTYEAGDDYEVTEDVNFTAQWTESGGGNTITATLTQSKLGLTGSYTTNTEKTVDDITYVYTDLQKNNDNIQAKASTGTIRNTTAYPGDITSVAITHSGTARATTINGSADGTNWTQVATGSGSITADFTGKGYKYFQITRGSNAAYWSKVEITYSNVVTYTVSFDCNGGTANCPDDIEDLDEGDDFTIPSTAPTRDCYTFGGWFDDELNEYELGNTYQCPASDLTLTADWTLNKYTVTYYSNNGETGEDVSDNNLNCGSAYTIADDPGFTEPTATPNFVGWNTQADGQGIAYTVGQEITISGNLSLYAQWSALALYDVVYDCNGGTENCPADQSYPENTVIQLPAAPVYAGHTFNGWYDGDNTYLTGADFTVTDDVMFQAQWLVNLSAPTFTVTGVSNGTANTYYVTATITINQEEGASIYYTKDGSDPSDASTEYGAPFAVTNSCTIKAIAIFDGYGDSQIVSQEIIIVQPNEATFTDGVYTTLNSSDAFNTWYAYSVTGDQVWTWSSTYAKMTGYVNSTNYENEDWLISPKMHAVNGKLAVAFQCVGRYGNSGMATVYYSTNYPGYGNPNSYTWTEITTDPATLPYAASNWNFTDVTCTLNNEDVYFAVKYISSNTKAGTLEVKNFTAKQCYPITYYANGGTGTTADANSPYAVGTEVTILENAFTAPTGKEFTSWNTQSDGLGTTKNPGNKITMTTDGYELYAIWGDACVLAATMNATTGEAVYDYNSGEKRFNITPSSSVKTLGGCDIYDYGFVYSTTVATPEIDADNCTKVQVGDSQPTIDDPFEATIEDVTKEATYHVRSYATNAAGTAYSDVIDVEVPANFPVWTISYTTNGTADGTTTVDKGDAISGLATPTPANIPAGYTFTGWYGDDYALNNVAPTFVKNGDAINSDLALKAVFAIQTGGGSADTYSLVENVNDLHDGDIVVLYSTGSYTASQVVYDFSKANGGISNNLFSDVDVTVDNNQFTSSDVEPMTLVASGNSWKLQIGNQYVSAVNKGVSLDNTGSLNTITISDGTATITATISSTNYRLQYNSNSGNGRFAYYSSTQKSVKLYKQDSPIYSSYCTSVSQQAAISGTITEGHLTTDGTIAAGTAVYLTTPLTINNGVTLTVNGALGNDNPANLIIEDGGQIIHDNAGVKATVKKSITGYGTGTGNYYLLVTPFTENIDPASVTNMIAATPTDYDLYQWNSSEAEEWRNYKQGTFTLNNGIGYLYANKNNVELTFTGTLKQSNEVVTVNPDYITADFGDWTLVGNPFACNAYLTDTADMGNAFYRMNTAGNGFTAVASGTIAPMEGIFVKATAASQSFKFTREAPVTSPGKGNLNINVAQVVNSRDAQPVADNAIIRFDGGNNLKKFSFREDNTKVYIPQNGKDYAVVNAQAQGEMPVNFKAAENGTYTIDFSMDNVEFSYLHLIDNKTGMDINLLQTSSYTFEASKIDYASRFKLVFSTNNNSNSNDDNSFAFFDANGNLMILGIDGTATLQVIDITGRAISNETFSGNYSKAINAKAGVYMLRLIQGNDVRTQKIVVR